MDLEELEKEELNAFLRSYQKLAAVGRKRLTRGARTSIAQSRQSFHPASP
jgi:hypothetical protein